MSGPSRSTDLGDEAYANLAMSRRLMRRYLAFSERAAESAGLEPQHYQLLLMLRGLTPHGGASVSDLADWLQIRHHSAVGLVDRIEARSLVQRRPDPLDGRRVLVVLTRHGRSALRSLAVLHRNELRRLAPDLVDALQQLVDSPRSELGPDRLPTTSPRTGEHDTMSYTDAGVIAEPNIPRPEVTRTRSVTLGCGVDRTFAHAFPDHS